MSSKEEKEALLNKRMEEIRLKNEVLQRRHEVCFQSVVGTKPFREKSGMEITIFTHLRNLSKKSKATVS